MQDKRSLHLKLQEMCDCFATADPMKEMSVVHNEQDKEEAALKWLALAILQGINDHAKKITFTRTEGGEIKALAKYQEVELPSPGAELGEKILEMIKGITHLEEEGGKTPLALGIRDSSLDLTVKVGGKEGEEEVVLKFPRMK